MNLKNVFLALICFCLSLEAFTQTKTIKLVGDIEDKYLQMPLTGACITIMDGDSTVVVDSASILLVNNSFDKLEKVIFHATVKAEKRNYLIRASRSGYEDMWQEISVLYPDIVSEVTVPTFKMSKIKEVNMEELVVTATKIKMFYKGDTLVYNADAFNLPNGSMLDDLIKQMPGVTINENGQIFVNGRMVDELLLGARSFMGGNKQILMDNLPYYTVKNIKVYEKQSDMSEFLGYDVGARKYVMDVNLKNEYIQGYIANVEAAIGTNERFLGRGFLLGFNDLWRYSLMLNTNNVNESQHIGEQGYWTPTKMPQSLTNTHSVSMDLDFQAKNKNFSNNFNANYTHTSEQQEMHQHQELFLVDTQPISMTLNYNRNANGKLYLENVFSLKKNVYLTSRTNFNYSKQNGSGLSLYEQWDKKQTTSMHTDIMSEGRNWAISQEINGAVNLSKAKRWHMTYIGIFRHQDYKQCLSAEYDTWYASTQSNNIRLNANDVSDCTTNLLLSASSTKKKIFGDFDLLLGEEFQSNHTRRHDYLYHPDTLLLASQLDMLTAITDVSNSYDSQYRNLLNTAGIKLSKSGYYQLGNTPLKVAYEQFSLNLDVQLYVQSLKYMRGIIDTLTNNTSVFFRPKASYRYKTRNHDLRISAGHDRSPADLLNQIAYRDDSQPLVVKEGNPDLKGRASTNISATYSIMLPQQQQWNFATTFRYNHRDVAQSIAYDRISGIYTYKPMNIYGSYIAKADFGYSRAIGEKRYWTWQINGYANYNHSIDYSMFEGETESHENVVNTTNLHGKTYIQYNRKSLNIRLSGDVNWRYSEGKMQDFSTLSAIDYNYGLSCSYTLPVLKTSLSADATMYSRQGYGSMEMNRNDIILNASASQSLMKGKLIVRIEAFDLLNQLSSTQYEVNAQGRTETWYRSLPNYVMLHLVYHWNKNPKKL